MMGLSTMGDISLGCALVAGRKRVPRPAAGKTALRTFIFMTECSLLQMCNLPQRPLGWLCLFVPGSDLRQRFLMDGETGEQVVQLRQNLPRAAGFQEELQNPRWRKLRALVRRHKMGESFRVNLGVLMKTNVELVAFALNADSADPLAKQAQGSVINQATDRARKRAVTVFELGADFVKLRLALHARNALVHAEALIFFGNVVVGYTDVEREVELDFRFFGSRFAAQLADGALEHRSVKLEANRLNLSTLFPAQKVPRATKFQIQRSELEARTQVGELL